MTPNRALHLSLVIVWLGTALVSALEANGQGAMLLQEAGIGDPRWQAVLIWSGAAVDLTIGLVLWRRPGRLAYGAAMVAMTFMTLIATVLQPALWLHPLGPLLKNLPIAAALWLLMCIHDDRRKTAA